MDTTEQARANEARMPELDEKDLLELLALRQDQWLGRILSLNRSARYHNSLDAVTLSSKLKELVVVHATTDRY
jgi:hypothetical protein